MAIEGAAIRKRQQIAKANRTMFFWVAGVSVIVGASIVVSIFLFQKLVFNEKVLAEKNKTVSTLKANNKVAGDLQSQIRRINTDDNLKKLMITDREGNQPIQVVLDALPATANSSGFGASLQRRFLEMGGLTVESMNVDLVSSEMGDDNGASAADGSHVINFSFSVRANGSGSVETLKNLLLSLEKSIRPINVTNTIIEVQGDGLLLSVTGNTYYEPAQTVELGSKVVKP